MGHSTIDLLATNEELTTFAREFAEKHDLWVTVIRFPSLVVCGRPWADIESHVRQPIAPLDCLEIVLTFVEPNLDGVGQAYDLLEKNLFPEWVAFNIASVGTRHVLASRVISWLSNDSQHAREVRSLLRSIRKVTMTGMWAFTADLKVREYYTTLTRYTRGAKALQDAGARVSDYASDPPCILGKNCPHPLSEATIFYRKAGIHLPGSGG